MSLISERPSFFVGSPCPNIFIRILKPQFIYIYMIIDGKRPYLRVCEEICGYRGALVIMAYRSFKYLLIWHGVMKVQ